MPLLKLELKSWSFAAYSLLSSYILWNIIKVRKCGYRAQVFPSTDSELIGDTRVHY
jgi:hypothetical protein